MRTPYLRNVPDDVRVGLEVLAAGEGMSVSAFAVRELSRIALRAGNPTLLGDLPSLAVKPPVVVADLRAGRSGR